MFNVFVSLKRLKVIRNDLNDIQDYRAVVPFLLSWSVEHLSEQPEVSYQLGSSDSVKGATFDFLNSSNAMYFKMRWGGA